MAKIYITPFLGYVNRQPEQIKFELVKKLFQHLLENPNVGFFSLVSQYQVVGDQAEKYFLDNQDQPMDDEKYFLDNMESEIKRMDAESIFVFDPASGGELAGIARSIGTVEPGWFENLIQIIQYLKEKFEQMHMDLISVSLMSREFIVASDEQIKLYRGAGLVEAPFSLYNKIITSGLSVDAKIAKMKLLDEMERFPLMGSDIPNLISMCEFNERNVLADYFDKVYTKGRVLDVYAHYKVEIAEMIEVMYNLHGKITPSTEIPNTEIPNTEIPNTEPQSPP